MQRNDKVMGLTRCAELFVGSRDCGFTAFTAVLWFALYGEHVIGRANPVYPNASVLGTLTL